MERAEIYGRYRQAAHRAKGTPTTLRRARQVRRTRRATHRLLAHVRQVPRLCRAEPPRQAARREPPRLVSWWHARRLNARARQADVRRRHAEPAIDSRAYHCAARAEPSRQDRRHAADSTPAHAEPAKGTPSTAADNVTRLAYATSVITPHDRVELSGKHSG